MALGHWALRSFTFRCPRLLPRIASTLFAVGAGLCHHRGLQELGLLLSTTDWVWLAKHVHRWFIVLRQCAIARRPISLLHQSVIPQCQVLGAWGLVWQWIRRLSRNRTSSAVSTDRAFLLFLFYLRNTADMRNVQDLSRVVTKLKRLLLLMNIVEIIFNYSTWAWNADIHRWCLLARMYVLMQLLNVCGRNTVCSLQILGLTAILSTFNKDVFDPCDLLSQ